MSEKKIHFDDADALVDVVSKLCTVSDFMQMLDDNFSLRKRTPEGLSIIIGECIDTLNRIGGFREQPSN
jgi:hypothetical protein